MSIERMIIGIRLLELFDLNKTGSKTPNEIMFENYDRGKGIPNASLCVCDICIWFKITFDVFGLHFFYELGQSRPRAG